MPDPLLSTLLRRLHLRIRADIHQAILEAGFDDLTPAHVYVFQLPGPDGLRPSELARSTNTTKQAMNHLLGRLEANGYLTRRRDSSDGRSKVLHVTTKGRQVMKIMSEVSLDIERYWADALGSHAVETLRRGLQQADSLHQDGASA